MPSAVGNAELINAKNQTRDITSFLEGKPKSFIKREIWKLDEIISGLDLPPVNGGVSVWGVYVVFRESLRIRIGQAAAAANNLRPFVFESGLLNQDPGAHSVYAMAEIRANNRRCALGHLEPLVAEGGLGRDNLHMNITYASLLIEMGRFDLAVAHLRPSVEGNGIFSSVQRVVEVYAKALRLSGDAVAADQQLDRLHLPKPAQRRAVVLEDVSYAAAEVFEAAHAHRNNAEFTQRLHELVLEFTK